MRFEDRGTLFEYKTEKKEEFKAHADKNKNWMGENKRAAGEQKVGGKKKLIKKKTTRSSS